MVPAGEVVACWETTAPQPLAGCPASVTAAACAVAGNASTDAPTAAVSSNTCRIRSSLDVTAGVASTRPTTARGDATRKTRLTFGTHLNSGWMHLPPATKWVHSG